MSLAAVIIGVLFQAAHLGGVTTTYAQDTCVRAVAGDGDAEAACLALILEQADAYRIEAGADPSGACMAAPSLTSNDLIWIYLDWLSQNPEAQAKPAETTINTALIAQLPCGWTLR